MITFSCTEKDESAISLISVTEFTTKDRPIECNVLDRENYGHGYTQFVVQNNTNDTLKIKSAQPKTIFPIAHKVEYYTSAGIFEQGLPIGFVKTEYPSDYNLFLLPKSLDTIYLCHVKSSKFKSIWYKIDFMRNGEVCEQYLE